MIAAVAALPLLLRQIALVAATAPGTDAARGAALAEQREEESMLACIV